MARCIICKHNSDQSKSVEHIVPESFGNKNFVLPKGVVCDKCNNYISRKIERPFLNDPYIKEIRFNSRVLSKKKKSPIIEGMHLQTSSHIGLSFDVNDHSINVGAIREKDEEKWVHSVLRKELGTLIIPAPEKPDRYLMSRFLAKVALEAFAEIALRVPGGIDEIIDKEELDELRQYIRRGSQTVWPYTERRIYPVNKKFQDGNEQYEILHEYVIFKTDIDEYYLIFCLNGIEYALNLGGAEIEGYENWLKQNKDMSPLYIGELKERHQ